MNLSKKTGLVGITLFIGIAFAILAQPVSAASVARIPIEVYMANGDVFTGIPVSEFKGKLSLFTRIDKRSKTIKLCISNLVHFEFKPTEKQELSYKGKSDFEKLMIFSENALERRLARLASMKFSSMLKQRASNKDQFIECCNAIKKAYASSKLKYPANLPTIDETGKLHKPAGDKSTDTKIHKHTWKQIQQADQRGQKWASAMKKTATRFHTLKTGHFYLCTEWPASDDKPITETIERLYDELCKQFNIPDGKHIWPGRLYVFTFEHRKSFGKFYQAATGKDTNVERVGGLGGYTGSLNYIMINSPSTAYKKSSDRLNAFLAVMVHEAAHTFVQQAHGKGYIQNWVNEGIAESMAQLIVKQGPTRQKYALAMKHLAAGKTIDQKLLFDSKNIPLDPVYYGVCNGLVQLLAKIDSKKFEQFFKAMKAGKSDAQALKDIYNLTRPELLQLLIRRNRR